MHRVIRWFCGLAVVWATGTAATAQQVAAVRPPSRSPYLAPGTPEVGGIRHMVLIYHGNKGRVAWTKDAILPYVAYLDERRQPVDWLFDSFLLIEFALDDGTAFHHHGRGERLPTLTDWQWIAKSWFRPNQGLDGLEQAVAEVAGNLGPAERKSEEGLQPSAPGSTPDSVPIQLHPGNPHYFLWRGEPTVLITSGEHYGAVMNLDFDYVRYLDELKACGFNLTRTFSGTYREVAGSFNITGNTLAPAPGRYLCPWPRSSTPGASDGGNKFDLAKWDGAYFERLKDFVAQAGRRGIVVEIVLFCTMYDEKLWSASPMNARNNTGGIGAVGPQEVYDAKDNRLLAAQQAVTRKIVTELKDFDNVYFEACNEPYERPGLAAEWNDRIISAIVEAEATLPARHLIAQGIGHGRAKVARLNENVCVLNFHAATVEAVRLNYDLGKVIADDETGGADRGDRKYRTEGWNFILAGGGVYDHLDLSFTPEREDGTAVPLPPGTPGGGGPELRRQLAILKQFIEGFDFVRMRPDHTTITTSRIAPASAGSKSQTALKPTVRLLAEAGKAYAVYVNGGTRAELSLQLPAGPYRAEWVNTKTGAVKKPETFSHAGGSRAFASPAYAEDIALRVQRQ